MPSPSAIIRGLVSRLLPPPEIDGPDKERALRLGRYGDAKVESVWPTDHLQADEGDVWIAATAPGATALQLGISGSWSATAAAIAIGNADQPGASARKVYLKALRMAVLTVGTSGVDLRYAIVLDPSSRQPTTVSNALGANQGPGTPATATAYRAPMINPNLDIIAGGPASMVYFPLSTAGGAPPAVPAAGPNARIIVGNGYIKNTALAAKDQLVLQFGSADIGGTLQGASAAAKIVEHAPAVVIAPGGWALVYLWSSSNVTAGNAFDDMSLILAER